MALFRFIGFLVFIAFIVSIGMNVFYLSGAEQLVGDFQNKDENIELEEPIILSENKAPLVLPENFSIEGFDSTKINVEKNVDLDDIKYALAQGQVVIAHIDTSTLNNPFYTERDDIFVTITGFTTTHFITQESGIRSGGSFVYVIEDFMDALDKSGGDIVLVRTI